MASIVAWRLCDNSLAFRSYTGQTRYAEIENVRGKKGSPHGFFGPDCSIFRGFDSQSSGRHQGGPEHPNLTIHYSAPENEHQQLDATLKRVKNALLKLGCFVLPGRARVRATGTGVHYAGTLPMTEYPAEKWTTNSDCRGNDFKNLFIVDGSAYPFLPAKNTTFTLMVNAMRVADSILTRQNRAQ